MNIKNIKPSTSYLLPAALLLSSCTYMSQGVLNDDDRNAQPVLQDRFGDSAKAISYLDQNWNAADSLWFYNTTQGSNLLPWDIFLNLELAASEDMLRSDENMNGYRYLTQNSNWDNPAALPVGFVKNTYLDEDFVGLTCAACHTTQINYNGHGIRIDGAPTLANMEGLLLDIESSLRATLEQQDKFERMAAALGATSAEAITKVRTRLQTALDSSANYNRTNAPSHGDEEVRYGYARLDAFGRIYNRILGHMTPGEDNFNPANAPVSYPFLWDTPQSDFVQWNGVGDNAGAGALGRNTGEVLGVFASFELTRKKGELGYRSSAEVRNLNRLERHLESLQSPLWPKALPAINQALAATGQEVFMEYQCHSCHEAINRSDPNRRVIAQFASLDAIGTDRSMADNAFNYAGKSGLLEGKKINALKPKEGEFGSTTKVLPALSKAGLGVIVEASHSKPWYIRWPERIYDVIASVTDNPIKKTERHLDFEIVNNGPEDLLAYKARPLNGIWATAPYLHNGSVPNLYDLFLPSCSDAEIESGKTCRPNTFTLGSREFDPVNVGFMQKSAEEYKDLFVFDTRKPSNANVGHEYAVGVTPIIKLDANGKPVKNAEGVNEQLWLPPITDAKRLALVEYLKTL